MEKAELGSLRAELRAAGLFEHRELQSWLKLTFLFACAAAALVGVNLLGFWYALVLVPVAAWFLTAAAMLGHEGSHKSFSKSPTRNAVLKYLAFPLLAGLGSLYWHNKHDLLHHGHPNVEGVDPDIRPWPFVSSRGDHHASTPGLRWFQRNFQSWAFWPMSTLMAIGMRRSSILYVISAKRTRAWWIEVACLTTHYVMWLVVPSLVWGPLVTFALYAGLWSCVGVFLALVFAPAHIGLPIMSAQNHDWVHQLETTRNLQMPKWLSFFFIGLDYQVEHHLFPKIPHQHLPRAAEITAAFCARHGIPHLSVPYLYALGDAAKFIAYAWDRQSEDPIEVRAGLVA
ncbi:MAG TPA: acyl-CoA desaturase [Kofleriaceae bacterium]|nr:acyl-CoA desaturase [Kofleriaceae bacterium]